MHVRLLRSDDGPAVRELLRQLGYDVPISELAERMEQVLATGSHYAAVAEQDGAVVGLVHALARPALEKPCEAVVQSLVVDRGTRGLGIGRQLMAAAEDWARSEGLASLALHTRIDRSDACRFYERIGYRKAATAHYLKKELQPR